MAILGLRTAIYKVGNIKEATEWYTKAFEVSPYFEEDGYVGFNVAGYELGLQPESKPTTEKVESVINYWGVEDIRGRYQHFLDLGATEHEPPTNVGGALEVATVKDPWGNILGLIYNPDFKL
ncbi:VOC family protein [Reichenbachiella sp.]|uniref:VOC family protein n=1 Tax=Reichenbachiella sp. TaxID=2184521 RepID=UPI003BAEB86E